MYQCSHRGAKTTPTNTHGIDCNVNNYTKNILECKACQCEKKLMIVNMHLLLWCAAEIISVCDWSGSLSVGSAFWFLPSIYFTQN